ncbi:ABC transporter A family member 1 isoform X2 [Prunus yedoensis var. nudiflora]|uniref:ABC transporter A family member 1 isoform X2 n=1 Tax=Prunus yedoensis var. nudiflora TaxID=2094558 RepID=A0A314Y4V8_PRUYE|nr:ABC transporter A family member 1 isoform X2 [Prunus yedoensis var. nudiflora]
MRIVPFPTREYTDDEFQSIIKSVMGVLYLLGFLHPISRLISYSVFEKEQKIREGLYMTGLEDGILHLSWFIAIICRLNVSIVYKDEQELETYIGSDLYGTCNQIIRWRISGFLD